MNVEDFVTPSWCFLGSALRQDMWAEVVPNLKVGGAACELFTCQDFWVKTNGTNSLRRGFTLLSRSSLSKRSYYASLVLVCRFNH